MMDNKPNAYISYDITIGEAHQVTPGLIKTFEYLIPQLGEYSSPSEKELYDITQSKSARLLLAYGKPLTILGTLTLLIITIPSGTCARIEDFVVDKSMRGKGIGKALMREALRRAENSGAKLVDLTSHPNRTAANNFYLKVGFNRRKTNVYRYKLNCNSSQ